MFVFKHLATLTTGDKEEEEEEEDADWRFTRVESLAALAVSHASSSKMPPPVVGRQSCFRRQNS
jgi:hypothetical protein